MKQVKPKTMSKREEERALFEAFLQERPRFADEPLKKWNQPEKEFPDVECITITGRKIGVELCKWLSEKQIRDAKKMERIQESILSAVGNQGDNITKNIFCVLLFPKSNPHLKPNDLDPLREELFRCIEQVDGRWLSEPLWHSPQGYRATSDKFSSFPILQKYLASIWFLPRKRYEGRPPNGRFVEEPWPRGRNWILFPNRGGSYSEDTMLQPLTQQIAGKKKHYSGVGTGFDSLYLIVYYNSLAAIYNTPVETGDFEFKDIPERLKQKFIEDGPNPFNQIFLFVAHGLVFTVL